ncbi:hypothetical protein JXJ21_21350 [candidate division KSB1 bacterium]|nr:hypothetical protein [candidate division KSB1 bacterium]
MLSFINKLHFNRYLIVWRVNSSLAFFPRFFSLDLSMVIGSIIANRLPTKELGPWRKAIAPLEEHLRKRAQTNNSTRIPVPDISWPLHSVLFVYPSKRTFSRNELIIWELKLFGEHADHGMFLEVILPAMEEASYTTNPKWNRRNRIWGHFDIQSVFIARGHQWEPIVQDGRLNLRYQAKPTQWLEGLQLKPNVRARFRNLVWLTPYEFGGISPEETGFLIDGKLPPLAEKNAPTMARLFIELALRMRELSSRRLNGLKLLDESDREKFLENYEKASTIPFVTSNMRPAPASWPGRWLGSQRFASIPSSIVPYLELASILHIGKLPHFGCGTFLIA